MIKDISSLFKNTSSHIIGETIKAGGAVLGLEVDKFNGILVKNDKLSNLLQDEIVNKAGVRGFISTDELPQYGINMDDKKNILKTFKCAKDDVVVIVADKKDRATAALKIIAEKIAARQAKTKAKPKKAAKKVKKAKPKKAAKTKKTKPKKAKKSAPKKKREKR
jgi:Glu-tRNA(Gln) amidotransferase subunit E-like FAD-binding protein